MLVREKYPFTPANTFCKAMGGTLASIHNEEENDFIKEYIRTNGSVILIILIIIMSFIS